jgi:hypothetical protein
METMEGVMFEATMMRQSASPGSIFILRHDPESCPCGAPASILLEVVGGTSVLAARDDVERLAADLLETADRAWPRPRTWWRRVLAWRPWR